MRPSLMRHLLAWALGALVLVWGSFIVFAYKTGTHEADELTDGHLASVVALLMRQRGGQIVLSPGPAPLPELPELHSHDYQQSLSIFLWDRAGRLLTRTGQAPEPVFEPSEGFSTLQLGNPPAGWRVFARWDHNADHASDADDRRIMVMLSVQERDELAEDIAGQITQPGLWLLPIVALALSLAIRKGLRPLYELSREVDALDIHQATPLRNAQPYQEFRAVIDSINTLMDRYHAALTRERQLASELAHELRTPLASLALHARSLRGEQPGAEQAASLARIEQDALRAGDVLSHLLALARASRTEIAETAQPLDLDELARRVVGEYAQAALDSGHDLALHSDQPFPLKGHPVLLEVALRNLIENALAHTPRGTAVDVRLDASALWLQVSDDGQRLRAPAAGNAVAAVHSLPDLGLGFGLGHRVVEKIAAIHSAEFGLWPGLPEQTCYRLTFAQPGETTELV